jgi:NADPH-dependent glutamate synthase beta subunit-like oxidoreductase
LVARDTGRINFKPVPGTDLEMDVDLVLLAMGFLGPERNGMLDQLGVKLTDRANVWRDENWMTSVPGVFAAGDMQRGQSLIVWAIAEGRSPPSPAHPEEARRTVSKGERDSFHPKEILIRAARGRDLYLMGRSDLPAPLS